jgi:hypothetical protein
MALLRTSSNPQAENLRHVIERYLIAEVPPNPQGPAAPPEKLSLLPAGFTPPDSSGMTEKVDGVLLRFDPVQHEWLRLTEPKPLARFDRVLCLTPFRAPISLGKTRITLVGQTEIRVLSRPTDEIPSLDLTHGRVLIRQSNASSLNVGFAGRTLKLAVEPGSSIGLERTNRRTYGQSSNGGFPLVVYCSSGNASLTSGKQTETLKASVVAIIETNGPVTRAAADKFPTWVVEPGPSSAEVELKEQFLPVFHSDRPAIVDMVVASEDDRPGIKSLALVGLLALGDASLLMPVLSRAEDPIARRFAVGALRDYMSRSPESAKEVRDDLAQEFGEPSATLVEKMLIGYSRREASKPELFKQLVGLLSPEQPSVGVRELALDTLQRLTGRDDLGYSVDHPVGQGLAVWQELLARGKLKVRAPSFGPK